jgi:hypothetical protein
MTEHRSLLPLSVCKLRHTHVVIASLIPKRISCFY